MTIEDIKADEVEQVLAELGELKPLPVNLQIVVEEAITHILKFYPSWLAHKLIGETIFEAGYALGYRRAAAKALAAIIEGKDVETVAPVDSTRFELFRANDRLMQSLEACTAEDLRHMAKNDLISMEMREFLLALADEKSQIRDQNARVDSTKARRLEQMSEMERLLRHMPLDNLVKIMALPNVGAELREMIAAIHAERSAAGER